jgi:hypothetical protein
VTLNGNGLTMAVVFGLLLHLLVSVSFAPCHRIAMAIDRQTV